MKTSSVANAIGSTVGSAAVKAADAVEMATLSAAAIRRWRANQTLETLRNMVGQAAHYPAAALAVPQERKAMA
ncbi:hypothetical protein LAD77_01205 [Klebsiella pneumoniae]|nr:hypothetical protein [Klebsiella pneumoniae]